MLIHRKTTPDRPEQKALESTNNTVTRVDAQTVESLKNIINKKSEVIDEQRKRITMLEEYLRLERARHYGRSSEKSPKQAHLFNEAEMLACDEAQSTEDASQEPQSDSSQGKKKKGNGGRKPLSKNIPREQVFLNLSEEDKAGALNTFFTKVKEELDIVPAKVRVLEYMQEKAVFDNDAERRIKAAELPKHPIAKSVASISMLAYVIVAKYCDALPLYRQEKILQRYGGSITRTTLANWMIRLSIQLQPLINLMREHQLAGDYIQADETRIQVLKEEDRSALSNKYMWVTLGGPPDQPAILYEYDPSRGQEVPLRLLEEFSGYLQVDGYAGYNAVCNKVGVKRLGCFDHCRRKFVDAFKAQPAKIKLKRMSKAGIALEKIGKLYALEQRFKLMTPQERYRERQIHSIPLLRDFKEWADEEILKTDKESLLGKALIYTINQWTHLIRYCEDGRLSISNAGAENAIRPFVVGRKAWLFADTPAGANASATYYSLVESAKANELEPYEYLSKMLTRLPHAASVEDYEALLPWNAKAVFCKATVKQKRQLKKDELANKN